MSRYRSPAFAHVPGSNPRHPDGAFDALRRTAHPGLTAAELARSEAWLAGWQYLDEGFNWEAHEVWEAVWMALPVASRDRRFVQACIQTANAALKVAMARPKAALRICGLARGLLANIGEDTVMGARLAVLHDHLLRTERAAASTTESN